MMLMPSSSEFIALSQSQVTLLTKVLGASLSVVYLTESLLENASSRLMPIAAYPDSAERFQTHNALVLPPESKPEALRLEQVFQEVGQLDLPQATQNLPEPSRELRNSSLLPAVNSMAQSGRLVLPLIHQDIVFGLLVTERHDRPWQRWERSQVKQVADTLALACVLDQRAQWLEQNQRHQRLVLLQQHDVLDNLLHQLRSPLTALKTFGKLLMKRLMAEDANQELAASIIRESDRLQELLKQVDQAIDPDQPLDQPMDWVSPPASATASPTAQPIPLLPAGVLSASNLELEACSIGQILQPLLSSAQPIAQEKNLQLKASVPEPLSLVMGNSGALREVFSNLIDNAIKYTPSGGQVHVRVVQPATDHVAVCVTDTGLGIPAADLPHLFERHYRGIQAQGTIPGTGLGLAIAQRLVEQMSGKIEAFSPLKPGGWLGEQHEAMPRNQGTTFLVELPTVDA